MSDVLTQLGVGGIFALLVVREVLNFLKAKKNGGNGAWIKNNPVDLHLMDKRVEQIRDWADRDEITHERQAAILEKQTKILEDLKNKVPDICRIDNGK